MRLSRLEGGQCTKADTLTLILQHSEPNIFANHLLQFIFQGSALDRNIFSIIFWWQHILIAIIVPQSAFFSALVLIPLIFVYYENGRMRTIGYSLLSNSLVHLNGNGKLLTGVFSHVQTAQVLKWWESYTSGRRSCTSGWGSRMSGWRSCTSWTLHRQSTVSQRVWSILEITSNKPVKLCLFLIYLVSCCQKPLSPLPHSSDNIKWLMRKLNKSLHGIT